MTSKYCTKCKELKPLSEFRKQKATKDGCTTRCGLCLKETDKSNHRNKKGLIRVIYGSQLRRSRKRGHNPPDYSLEQLRTWALNQQIYHDLHDKWVKSGYKTALTPSFDRVDDHKGYSLDRLEIMTCQENISKGCFDRKNGINNKVSKTVFQLSINNEIICKHFSVNSAARKTGINIASIWECASGKRNRVTAGGFKWSY